jgi:hypothetical protein
MTAAARLLNATDGATPNRLDLTGVSRICCQHRFALAMRDVLKNLLCRPAPLF